MINHCVCTHVGGMKAEHTPRASRARPFARPLAATAAAGLAWLARRKRARGLVHLPTLVVLAAAAGGGVDSAFGVTITGLNVTGANYSASTATQDLNWRIVALPSSYVTGSAGTGTTTPPYAAWIFTGGSPSANVPGGWLGGSTNSGTLGAHWIGVRTNNSTALLPNPGTEGTSYSVIYATDFVASAAGSIPLSLGVSVDNRATLFVNGTVSGTNTNNPTISGGTQIGSTIYNDPPTPAGATKAFSILQTAAGLTDVLAGTNTLYVVVEDVANPSGVYGNTGVLIVPEPSSISIAAGLMLGGIVAVRRRRATG